MSSNIVLPNPATGQQITQSILQALQGAEIPSPALTVTPAVTGATTYAYTVVAKSNGIVVPFSFTITNGFAALSALDNNKIQWGSVALINVLYDVYRTSGGTTQGKIASNLTTNAPLIDIGLPGDGSTPPSFNTSGTLNITPIKGTQTLSASGAIYILGGTVFLTAASIVSATLPLPIAGPPLSGGQDGAELFIYSTTAYAHTVTTPLTGFNGVNHILTFTAAAHNFARLIALNGTWYLADNLNATLS